jgi:hypothetical protein
VGWNLAISAVRKLSLSAHANSRSSIRESCHRTIADDVEPCEVRPVDRDAGPRRDHHAAGVGASAERAVGLAPDHRAVLQQREECARCSGTACLADFMASDRRDA